MSSFQKFKQKVKLFSQLVSFSSLSWQQLSKNEKWKAYKRISSIKTQFFFFANFFLGSLIIQFIFPYLPGMTFRGNFFYALGCMALYYLIRGVAAVMLLPPLVILFGKKKQSPEYVEYRQKRREILNTMKTDLSAGSKTEAIENVQTKLKELKELEKAQKSTQKNSSKQFDIFRYTVEFLLVPVSLYVISKILPHNLDFVSLVGLLSASLSLYLLQKLLNLIVWSTGKIEREQIDIDELAMSSVNNPEFRKKAMKIFTGDDIEIE